MRLLLSILLLHALILTAQSYKQNISERMKRNSCSPKIKLEYCKPGINKRYTYYLYYQTTVMEVGCPKNKIEKVRWSSTFDRKVMNFERYSDKKTMIIAPGDLKEGNYVLDVQAKEQNGNWGSDTCLIQFITEPPNIIFKEGQIQYVQVGDAYTVDISPSKNYGTIPLNPIWQVDCEFKRTALCKDKICTIQPSGMIHKDKMDTCLDKVHYNVTLKHNGASISKPQTVNSKSLVEMVIKVNCLKNCDGKGVNLANPEIPVSMELVCLKNCVGFQLKTPKWDIKHPSQTFSSSDYKIVDKFQITIKEGVFKYDYQYLVVVSVGTTKSYYGVEMMPKIHKPECDVNPKIGISMETVFKISCKTTGYLAKTPPFYQVFQEKAGGTPEGMLIVESAYEEFDVVIGAVKGSPTQRLLLTGHDLNFNKFTGNIPKVTVKERKLTEDMILKELKKIDTLFEDGNIGKAMQYTNGLMIEVHSDAKIKNSPLLRKVFNKLIDSMTKVNIESVYSYRMMVSLLPMFYKSKTQDDTSRKKLATLCKKMASKQVTSLLKSKYATALEKEAKLFSKHTQLCVDEMLKPPPPPPPTTPSPTTSTEQIIDPDSVTENYPDYEAPTSPKKQETTQIAVDTIYESAKGVATTLVNDEEYHAKEANFETKLVKTTVPKLQNKEIAVEGSNVTISAAVNVDAKLTVTAVVSSYSNGLMDSEASNIVTNIVNVNVYTEENQQINEVKATFNLTMDNIKKDDVIIIDETVTVPADESTWNDKDMDLAMNVHRLPMTMDRKYVIVFHNMEKNDIIRVTVTVNRRPNMDDFRKSFYKVDGNIPTSQMVDHPYKTESNDAFIYFAILPHSDMLKGSGQFSLQYHIKFSELQCVIYNKEEQKWGAAPCVVYSLKAPSNKENDKIRCVCNHLTLFGGVSDQTESKLDKVEIIEFVTEKFVNYIVLIHVAIIFSCYCIALCFIIIREKGGMGVDKIYFLSDNLKNDRYAYAVIVRTGAIPGSGTSSNVTIKILAEVTDSMPHVLNYPDPEKRILQNDKSDCFILCTAQYLGKIKKIQLWFDSIGLRPNWYCEEIIIIDLQTKTKWHFCVEKWLNVLTKNNKIEAVPTKETSVNTGLNLIILKYFRFHGGAENTWNIFTKKQDHQFTYSQRITVILSLIYTTYTVIVFLLRSPEMRMSDAYGYGRFKYYADMVIFAFVSSIVATIINFPFVFLFRNSRKLNEGRTIIQEYKMLPEKYTIYTWVALCSWITICMIYLVLFGLWVTLNDSYMWIIIIVASILITALIMENIYIIFTYILIKKVAKIKIPYYNIPVILFEVEKQRKILFKKFGELLLRPYFKKHYHELYGLAAKTIRLHQLHRMKISNRFKDLCIFIIYIILLYTIALINSDKLLYYSNREIRRLFEEGTFGHMALEDVLSLDDMYDYLEETIIAILHTGHWYGKWYSVDGGLMIDFNTKIMGVVQLRQQRRQQVCVPPGPLVGLKIPCNNSAPIFDKWKYDDGAENTASLGQFHYYSSEGYTINLGRSLHNSNVILKYLKQNKWLDINTAVLFIEFWTYNANANIFNIVQIMIERDNTGDIMSTLNVFTARLFHLNIILEYVIICCMLLILLLVLTMFGKNIVLFIRNRSLYAQSAWNIFDFFLLILSAIYIILHFLVNNSIKKLIKKLSNSNNSDFVHYFQVEALSYGNVMVTAILLCMATVRLWKFFRFGKLFQIMERTIYKSLLPILTTFFLHWMTIMTFGIYAFVRYGAVLEVFSDYVGTITALSLASSSFNAQMNIQLFDKLGSTIYLWYAIFMILTMAFATFYMAILMQGYIYSSNYFSNLTKRYSVRNYIEDERKYLNAVLKNQYKNMRLRGGDDGYVDELVNPKGLTELYANCSMISNQKLRLIRNIALSVCHNRDRYGIKRKKGKELLSDEEFITMAEIFLDLSVEDQKDKTKYIFFHGTDPVDNIVKFVDNHRLLQMEYITKILLYGEEAAIDFSNQFVINVGGDIDKLQAFKTRIDLITQVLNNIRLK